MKYLKWFFLLVGLIGLDQGIKYLVGHYFPQILILNKGIIFGIRMPYVSFFIFLFLLIIAILFWISGIKKIIPLIFIFAGGISNLADRIAFGYVRDFVDLKYLPIFNLADIFIILGIALLFYLSSAKNTMRYSKN